MSRPDRAELLDALRAALASDLAALESVAAATRDEVGSSETKSEGKYDTRSTEASYLARGQAWRVVELRRNLAWTEGFRLAEAEGPVQLGSLVELVGERREWVLMAPFGGTTLKLSEHIVRVISPSAPLGRALLELEAGDGVEFESPRGTLEYEVGQVV